LCALLSCVNVCARHMYFTVNLLTYLLTMYTLCLFVGSVECDIGSAEDNMS